MNFKSHKISPKRYLLGNSQISFKQAGPNSELEMGQVSSIFWEENSHKYYIMVEAFIPLDGVETHQNPYDSLTMLQAKMVYQDTGKMLVLEEKMIQGHIATLAYSSGKSKTIKDTLCAVAINYGVRCSH